MYLPSQYFAEEKAALMRDAKHLQARLVSVELEVERWKQRAEKWKEREASMDRDLFRSRSRNAELEAEMQHYKTEYPRVLTRQRSCMQDCEDLRKQKSELQGTIDGCRDVESRHKAEIAQNHDEIGRLLEANARLQQALDIFQPVQEFCQEQNVQVPNFIGSVRESGLHAKDVVKLMAVLARFPPPVVSSVETMAAILRGPPRLSLYELREQVSATPDMRARADDAFVQASHAQAAMQREQVRRQDLEHQVTDLCDLARASERAMASWTPMIDFLKQDSRSPATVEPQEFARSLQGCGSAPSELMTLFASMAGPPAVRVSDLCEVIRAFTDQVPSLCSASTCKGPDVTGG